MYKLYLKKAEEPEVKLSTPAGSWKERISNKNLYVASLTTQKTSTALITAIYGKFLKELRIQDQLSCLLRNLYAGQEVTTGILHGTTGWFKTGKGTQQGCILSPCLFNFYAECIMRKAGLDESQAGIKIARRNISNVRHEDDTTLMAEIKEELEPLNEVETGK